MLYICVYALRIYTIAIRMNSVRLSWCLIIITKTTSSPVFAQLQILFVAGFSISHGMGRIWGEGTQIPSIE